MEVKPPVIKSDTCCPMERSTPDDGSVVRVHAHRACMKLIGKVNEE